MENHTEQMREELRTAAQEGLGVVRLKTSTNAIPRCEFALDAVQDLYFGRMACFDWGLPGWRRFARSVHNETIISSSFDLSNIDQFPNVETLDLSFIFVQDFSPLQALRHLHHLTLYKADLSDLSTLSEVTNELRALDLTGNRLITDFSPITHFTNLEYLNLSSCSGLSTLDIVKLSRLKYLNVRSTPLKFDPAWLDHMPDLSCLEADEVIECPKELLRDANILPKVLGWWRDLQQGESSTRQHKIIVLGNGGAGKSQIVRRLQGLPFDPAHPTTHGIDLAMGSLPTMSNSNPQRISIWDFGGQDIYHSTHALFADPHAIYLIVWTPALETVTDYVQDGLAMKHRPLQYWVDYVHSLAGSSAPVLLVQSQCDSELDARDAPVMARKKFDWMRNVSCSAKVDDGMDLLLVELKRALKYSKEKFGNVLLPYSWLQLESQLAEHRSRRRLLERGEFSKMVAALHTLAPEPVVLGYLHDTGSLFHRSGLFNDNLVLDQAWALDAIYSIFNRNGLLLALKAQHGRFTEDLLATVVWNKFTPEERYLLLSMMLQCRICFSIDNGEYIAPDLLPVVEDAENAIQTSWRGIPVQVRVGLHYEFLHEATLRELLSRIGNRAGNTALYWRLDVYCTMQNTNRKPRSRQSSPVRKMLITSRRIRESFASKPLLANARNSRICSRRASWPCP